MGDASIFDEARESGLVYGGETGCPTAAEAERTVPVGWARMDGRCDGVFFVCI